MGVTPTPQFDPKEILQPLDHSADLTRYYAVLLHPLRELLHISERLPGEIERTYSLRQFFCNLAFPLGKEIIGFRLSLCKTPIRFHSVFKCLKEKNTPDTDRESPRQER